MQCEGVEGSRLREQRVDAARAEALEVVAAGGRAVEDVAEPGADVGRLLNREDRLDDGVAVAVKVGPDASEQLLIHKSNSHAGTVRRARPAAGPRCGHGCEGAGSACRGGRLCRRQMSSSLLALGSGP